MFSAYTINTFSLNILRNNKIQETNINHLQPINSTELQQSSNQEVKLTLQLLPNIKKPPPRLQRPNLDHFNAEQLISKTSIQNSQQNFVILSFHS